MKKKVLATVGAMATAGVIGFTFTQSGVVNADPELTRDDIQKQVKELYPGEITELELDKEGNKAVYEVEIKLEGKEYELKINGDNGEVIKLEEKIKVSSNSSQKKDDEKDDQSSNQGDDQHDDTKTPPSDENTVEKKDDANDDADDNRNATSDDTPTKTKTDKKTIIGMREAETIALKNFSGTIVEKELEEDDGRQVYQVEIVNGNRQAEIEIDAYTGEVLVMEIETEDDTEDDADDDTEDDTDDDNE
ncbi:PepSY domain-containing protein [Virgibacillus kekensis]|uniref:PepSY domain-containing protein n=1 Tax=Virgibacillus kekensis TaxID=202261 RepID=A0ABV9DDH6_9BACI